VWYLLVFSVECFKVHGKQLLHVLLTQIAPKRMWAVCTTSAVTGFRTSRWLCFQDGARRQSTNWACRHCEARVQLGFVIIIIIIIIIIDHLCGLVVRVLGYRSGGPGSTPGTTRKKK
jgi:hypothetical protein